MQKILAENFQILQIFHAHRLLRHLHSARSVSEHEGASHDGDLAGVDEPPNLIDMSANIEHEHGFLADEWPFAVPSPRAYLWLNKITPNVIWCVLLITFGVKSFHDRILRRQKRGAHLER